jgi:hypothetical protein
VVGITVVGITVVGITVVGIMADTTVDIGVDITADIGADTTIMADIGAMVTGVRDTATDLGLVPTTVGTHTGGKTAAAGGK